MGTFENDDASDWVYQLEEADDLELVRGALQAAAEPEGYLEAPTCSEALAAAEVVAALGGRPAPDLPEEVGRWVGSHRVTITPDIRDLALRALDRIAGDSELQELWAESPESGSWLDRVRELRGRVAG